jgi:hypothetical protein
MVNWGLFITAYLNRPNVQPNTHVRKDRLPYSPAVSEALAEFGAALRELRTSRGIPMAQASQRVSISRTTLHKIERGDPTVSFGSFAALLDSYRLLDRLPLLTAVPLARTWLPRRIRTVGGG